VYAIGGIEDAARAREAVDAGAHGVAIVRAGMGALGEPASQVRAICDACHM
jgi:thiamine monophosphate synthase